MSCGLTGGSLKRAHQVVIGMQDLNETSIKIPTTKKRKFGAYSIKARRLHGIKYAELEHTAIYVGWTEQALLAELFNASMVASTYEAPKQDADVSHENCVGSLPDNNRAGFQKVEVHFVDY